MAITLNGTTGITNGGGYTGDGVTFADATPSNTLVTDTSGNVGIGTATPSGFKLFVSGGRTTLNSADDYALRIGKNGTYGAYIGSNAADVLNFYDSTGNEGFRLNNQTLQMNNGYGSIATFYGCRAWISFNGQTNSIKASGNVSSITDNGTADYTVNFTNAMPDANYSIGFGGNNVSDSTGTNASLLNAPVDSSWRKTTSIRFLVMNVYNGGVNYSQEPSGMTLSIFR
jgi:hypothetical protein